MKTHALAEEDARSRRKARAHGARPPDSRRADTLDNARSTNGNDRSIRAAPLASTASSADAPARGLRVLWRRGRGGGSGQSSSAESAAALLARRACAAQGGQGAMRRTEAEGEAAIGRDDTSRAARRGRRSRAGKARARRA